MQLNNISVQVGLPDFMLQESYVNQFYSTLSTLKLDFFLNVDHAVSFLKYYSEIKLKTKKEEYG